MLDINYPVEKKLWINFLNGNKFAAKGISLNFVEPISIDGETIIELGKVEINQGNCYMEKKFMILCVVGDSSSIITLKRFILNK